MMTSISETPTAIDRISNLPNNLIAHILSFLTTKDAIRTSALSTHWNQQWSSVTDLEFNDGVEILQRSTPRIRDSFVNFVYKVLLCKVTRLGVFQLMCGQYYDVAHISQWISIALSRDVQRIILMVPMVGRCLGSDCLFTSRTLVVLVLGMGCRLKVPYEISLKALKSIQLYDIDFEDGESLARLVSSCVVLEELRMQGKLSERVKVLHISSPVLRRLILLRLYSLHVSEIDGAHSYDLVLNTPSLRYLELDEECVPDSYHMESTLHYLDRVWLRLPLYGSQLDEDDDELILLHSLADLAEAISNVRFLDLSEYSLQALYRSEIGLPDYQLPKFPRLTYLDIGAIPISAGFSLLTAFLESSPQLESLSFALEEDLDYPGFWSPPTDVPFCMLHNLKIIEVVFYSELEPGLSMMKYFLQHTNCLVELIIPMMDEKNEELIDELMMLQWASKSCKIVLK